MKLRRTIRRLRRRYSIRYRLLRAELSPSSRAAERQADALIISYPKCGRTWFRMMLSRALALHTGSDDVDYLATDVLGGSQGDLPHIRLSHDGAPNWKTAARLPTSKRRYRHKKVVLIVRDPRDVVVSMYFERTKRERAYAKSLGEFLREPVGSLSTILQYYNIWAKEHSTPKGFCLVRYEDMHARPEEELRRVLDFLDIDVSDAHISEAVEFAAFDNMRQMETRGDFKSGRLRPRDPDDKESYKTRRGKVGGFVDYVDDDDMKWIDGQIATTLDPFFGYSRPAAVGATTDDHTA